MRFLSCMTAVCLAVYGWCANPVQGLLERIDHGASRKFVIEKLPSDSDFFELDQKGTKVVIRGNNYVSIATGINWYLKYYAHVHLSWNGMKARLPEVLPPVSRKERHATDLKLRYDLNYCTFSYSMAFWDWERWEQEIDWMALHGINLPLAIVGTDCVWRNVLFRLGYNKEEINQFIAGPAFQAWWLMNNLEGWGGPNPDSWYRQRADLQKKILKRMREYGMEPVLPGYSGMLPHDAGQKLGLNLQDPGMWNGYRRPAFLQPADPKFQDIAALYYEEMEKLYGRSNYYSMDPFHEGGSTAGVDMEAAGKAIWTAMKNVNRKAVWVVQAWGANPRWNMIKNLPAGDVLVLDLYSESRPQWGDPQSSWKRENGFGQHGWLYCMLLNFGGNVGLHGKMKQVIDAFYQARDSRFNQTLKGVGMTMEGIENNPVMYELLCELPWRATRFDKDRWLTDYTVARYGKACPAIQEAWLLLSNSIYNCPPRSTQQGTHESIFCARPSARAYQASSWSEMSDYYDPQDVIKAAGMFLSVADEFAGNNNFEYDLIDIMRQAVAEKGRLVYKVMQAAYVAKEKEWFDQASEQFLRLLLWQDQLLATRSEFKVGRWIEQAKSLGKTSDEKKLYEWNARTQVTTWGNRFAANNGGLHDYAHKEWSGLLKDFYYPRWKKWIEAASAELGGGSRPVIDWYAQEEPWTRQNVPYSVLPEGNCIDVAREIYQKAISGRMN